MDKFIVSQKSMFPIRIKRQVCVCVCVRACVRVNKISVVLFSLMECLF